MLLVGQTGGDGAKEEIAHLLAQRGFGSERHRGGWRLWKALKEGIVLGSRMFVEPLKHLFGIARDGSSKELCDGVVAGKTKFRRKA